MTRLSFCVLFPLFWLFSVASASTTDSLRSVIQLETSDTSRIILKTKLASELKEENPSEALQIGKEALREAQDLEFTSGIGAANLVMGQIYNNLGLREQAIENFLESYSAFSEAGENRNMALSLSELGNTRTEMGEFASGAEYFRQTIELAEIVDDNYMIIRSQINLATCYGGTREFHKADSLYQSLLSNPGIQANSGLMATIYNNLGWIAHEKGEAPSVTTEFYKLAVEELRKIPSVGKKELATIYTNLAESYVEEGNLSQASALLDTVWVVAAQSGNRPRLAAYYKVHSLLLAAQGNYEQAFTSQKRAREISDSLTNSRVQSDIANLMIGFEAERNLARIELLEQEKILQNKNINQQRVYLFVLATAAVLFLLMLILIFRKNRAIQEINARLQEKREKVLRQKREIEIHNEKLTELNQEKDGLIQVVAHDLKSPLNKTLGLLQLMEMEDGKTEQHEQFAGMIRKICLDAKDLVQDLLDVSQIENMESEIDLKPLLINEVVLNSIKSFRSEAKAKKIVLLEKMEPEPIEIQSDEAMLGRILDNLISNAIKFSDSGSEVLVGLKKSQEEICLIVKDNGPGFSEADQEKMFRKFQRLSARPTGGEASNGLGLSIVKTLVDRLGGRIEVNSAPGEGAEFRILLQILGNEA